MWFSIEKGILRECDSGISITFRRNKKNPPFCFNDHVNSGNFVINQIIWKNLVGELIFFTPSTNQSLNTHYLSKIISITLYKKKNFNNDNRKRDRAESIAYCYYWKKFKQFFIHYLSLNRRQFKHAELHSEWNIQ